MPNHEVSQPQNLNSVLIVIIQPQSKYVPSLNCPKKPPEMKKISRILERLSLGQSFLLQHRNFLDNI